MFLPSPFASGGPHAALLLPCLSLGASPPGGDLPRGPSCRTLPEPTVSLQPQKSQVGELGLKVQALEKTVASREHVVTEAARALQATAQAMLHKTEPLTQVGSCPLKQTWRRLGLSWGDLGVGGGMGQRRGKGRGQK